MKIVMWYVEANDGGIIEWCHDKVQAEYLLSVLKRDDNVRNARIGFKTFGEG